ncbi:MAG TPA: hypothetical protein VIJ94_08065, partial [Caulobacteraceae bacterium]
MRKLIAGALALAGVAVAAGPAAADTWSAAYTGTVVATYTDGHAVKVFIEPGHTFTITPASAASLHGTWQDAAGQTCFTITDPPAVVGGPPTCVADKAFNVGDGFDGKDGTG